MPKRKDIRRIMIIGSGPIVIGQACEFDYSGTQACKALRKPGYEIILFNMFPEVAPILGPEMRSTGEVLGLANNFGLAFYKAQEAAQHKLPSGGTVLITISERDRPAVLDVASQHDDSYIRKAAIQYKIPYITTLAAATVAARGIAAIREKQLEFKSLQVYHQGIK